MGGGGGVSERPERRGIQPCEHDVDVPNPLKQNGGHEETNSLGWGGADGTSVEPRGPPYGPDQPPPPPILGSAGAISRSLGVKRRQRTRRYGGVGGLQRSDKSALGNQAWRLGWGGPTCQGGGRLNDFTSPFQLQQLPIYIVMQIQDRPRWGFSRNMIIYPRHF